MELDYSIISFSCSDDSRWTSPSPTSIDDDVAFGEAVTVAKVDGLSLPKLNNLNFKNNLYIYVIGTKMSLNKESKVI